MSAFDSLKIAPIDAPISDRYPIHAPLDGAGPQPAQVSADAMICPPLARSKAQPTAMVWFQARSSRQIRPPADLHTLLEAIDWRRRLDAAVRARRAGRGVA